MLLASAWATRAWAASSCCSACATAARALVTSALAERRLLPVLTVVMGTLTLAARHWPWRWRARPQRSRRRPDSRCGSSSAMGSPGFDELVLFDVDLDDLAGDARADLNEVAVDLRVVGVFAEGGVPPEAEGDERDHSNTTTMMPAPVDCGVSDLRSAVRSQFRLSPVRCIGCCWVGSATFTSLLSTSCSPARLRARGPG